MGQDGHRWEDGRKCSGHPIRVEVVDDLVWDQVRKLIEQPRVVVQEYAKRNEKTSHTGDAIEDLLKKKELELRRVEHEKERLLDLYQLGDVSITEIKERLAKLRGKVELKQAEVVSLQNDLRVKHQRLTLVDSLEQFTSKLAKNLDQLRFDEKRKLVKLLVSRVYIDTKKEEIMVQHIVPIENLYPLCPGRIIPATE
jgi:site-specific DNA recombinase